MKGNNKKRNGIRVSFPDIDAKLYLRHGHLQSNSFPCQAAGLPLINTEESPPAMARGMRVGVVFVYRGF